MLRPARLELRAASSRRLLLAAVVAPVRAKNGWSQAIGAEHRVVTGCYVASVVQDGISRSKEPANNQQSLTMITLDAFLVFLGTALLPVIYFFILSRWIEAEYRLAYPHTTVGKTKSSVQLELAQQAA